MGVDVAESKLPVVSGEAAGDESSLLKENGKADEVVGNNEPITFGSHGVDEPVKEEISKPAEVNNFPKDAVDEWPAPQQIHSFYVVKYRVYEDQKLKAKLEQADLELTKKNQAKSQLIEKLRKLKGDRSQKISLLKALNEENKQYRSLIDEKKKEREPLQQALGTLGGRDRGHGICSSEEELNYRLKSLQYRIQHESIPLTEEKQILREIKQLEGTRPQVVANAALRAKIQESMGEKEALEDQMKVLRVDMDGVRKDQQVVFAKRKQLEEEKEVIDKQVKAIEEELDALTEKRDKTYQSIQDLRKQREEGNSAFYQNKTLLNKIRGLADKKEIDAVKELVETEVDKFISLWSTNKAFREDYERRILPSLDNRQMSRDGRQRNFDEKPILAVEKVTPPETEAVSRTLPKQAPPPKEDVAPTPVATPVEKEKSGKAQKEPNKAKGNNAKAVDDEADELDFYVPEKKQKDPPKVTEADELQLKALKREQEIAKAKQALERKKKLLEKAAAKAAIRAQKEAKKEAEKKQKALEKKEKKKAAVSADEPKENLEADEVAESEKSAEEPVETTVPSFKNKKEVNPMRRKTRTRESGPLPRTLLKRKKATNYWMWAAPAGAAITLLLVAVGYYYLN